MFENKVQVMKALRTFRRSLGKDDSLHEAKATVDAWAGNTGWEIEAFITYLVSDSWRESDNNVVRELKTEVEFLKSQRDNMFQDVRGQSEELDTLRLEGKRLGEVLHDSEDARYRLEGVLRKVLEHVDHKLLVNLLINS